jgi:inosine-uridine nucleoside N-ribohydrolase
LKRKIVIDCDPGIDHAVSLLYAARRFEIVGITTVHGNVPVETSTRNALRILALGGLTMPVVPGCAAPLVTAPRFATFVHGESGLDGAELPEPSAAPSGGHAVDFLIEQARTHRGELAVAALGPLTNLALAVRREPRLKDWIQVLSVMGGSIGKGNMTPVAEFNIWSDPEAASVVCDGQLPLQMVGYSITRQVGFGEAEIDRLRASGRKVGQAIGGLYAYFLARQRELWEIAAAPIHSPCAVVPLAIPEVVTYQRVPIAVELAGRHTRGMTVHDFRGLRRRQGAPFEELPQDGVANVAVAADGRRIVAEVLARLLEFD